MSYDERRAAARAMREAEVRESGYPAPSWDELPGFVQGWYERQVEKHAAESGGGRDA